jgi:hypothetical protein
MVSALTNAFFPSYAIAPDGSAMDMLGDGDGLADVADLEAREALH